MSWNVTMLESLVQKVQESKNKEFEVAALLKKIGKRVTSLETVQEAATKSRTLIEETLLPVESTSLKTFPAQMFEAQIEESKQDLETRRENGQDRTVQRTETVQATMDEACKKASKGRQISDDLHLCNLFWQKSAHIFQQPISIQMKILQRNITDYANSIDPNPIISDQDILKYSDMASIEIGDCAPSTSFLLQPMLVPFDSALASQRGYALKLRSHFMRVVPSKWVSQAECGISYGSAQQIFMRSILSATFYNRSSCLQKIRCYAGNGHPFLETEGGYLDLNSDSLPEHVYKDGYLDCCFNFDIEGGTQRNVKIIYANAYYRGYKTDYNIKYDSTTYTALANYLQKIEVNFAVPYTTMECLKS